MKKQFYLVRAEWQDHGQDGKLCTGYVEGTEKASTAKNARKAVLKRMLPGLRLSHSWKLLSVEVVPAEVVSRNEYGYYLTDAESLRQLRERSVV